ncbi:DUF551 domain-containing protein [Ruminococcus sp. AF31-8BH]|jgi:hypothetical protein|uniref:DUF551 domain-containing protein n=1 Tax=Ruminococcus sp. AF31-8BH TaxID=2293174 RepID=UPI000E4A9C65|nr:DUF551 domain-containing protein [Ruminococcus sp. AF31-8BH]RGF77041.1 DUF551 domain-containing protein [Ruminococcus sp. AF31-8BH]
MSHIKDRLSDYHDFMKKLADGHQMVLASDVLEMIEQIKDDLEQDEKENGWIPVSERLPEKNKDVITTVKYSGFMGMYGRWLKTAFIDGYGEWNGECIGGEVIAWMPLPEPYKED